MLNVEKIIMPSHKAKTSITNSQKNILAKSDVRDGFREFLKKIKASPMVEPQKELPESDLLSSPISKEKNGLKEVKVSKEMDEIKGTENEDEERKEEDIEDIGDMWEIDEIRKGKTHFHQVPFIPFVNSLYEHAIGVYFGTLFSGEDGKISIGELESLEARDVFANPEGELEQGESDISNEFLIHESDYRPMEGLEKQYYTAKELPPELKFDRMMKGFKNQGIADYISELGEGNKEGEGGPTDIKLNIPIEKTDNGHHIKNKVLYEYEPHRDLWVDNFQAIESQGDGEIPEGADLKGKQILSLMSTKDREFHLEVEDTGEGGIMSQEEDLNSQEIQKEHSYIDRTLDNIALDFTRVMNRQGYPAKVEVIEQLAQKIIIGLNGKKTEMELHVKPEHLGKLVLKIALEDGVLAGRIYTSNQQIKDFLQENMSSLKTSLQEQGFSFASLDVDVGSQSNLNKFKNIPQTQLNINRRRISDGVTKPNKGDYQSPRDIIPATSLNRIDFLA